MDIDLARTFLAIVETGSFLDAAARVHVTQSTVSMRIKSLEEQLGRTVFDRGKTGATLTTAGRHFLPHARSLVQTWAQARIDVGLPERFDTTLRIGATPSIWEGFLIDALPGLAAIREGIAVRASLGFSDTLTRDLLEGLIDLAVTYRPQNAEGLAAVRLLEDEFILVTSDPDPDVDPFGDNYVLIDWGPEFRADHLLNFPALPTPALQLGIGSLGLRWLLKRPASGYFPLRSVEPLLGSGPLRVIEGAPRFAYSVFAAYNDLPQGGLASDAAQFLRRHAVA